MKRIKRQDYIVVDSNGTPVIIDTFHEKIHAGKAYEISYKTVEGADIADNVSIWVVISSAHVSKPHLTFWTSAGGDYEIEWNEQVVMTGGTVITPKNVNRNYPDASPTTALNNPTINDAGINLFNVLVPGGTGGNAGGGTAISREGFERECAPTVNYMLRLTNRAGSAKPLSWAINWYFE